jgi:three-Cys-motif partner protein
METLLLVAERDGPEMLARIAVLKALNRHVVRVFNPDRKETHWGKQQAQAGPVTVGFCVIRFLRLPSRSGCGTIYAMAQSDHEFGGISTDLKLSVVGEYLHQFTTALRPQFQNLWFIDAFAGTGERTVVIPGRAADMLGPEVDARVERRAGSAKIAIDVSPAFDRLVFMDKRPKHIAALSDLRAANASRNISVVPGDANAEIMKLLGEQKTWTGTRAVMFLDPYGMSVDWRTLEAISKTEAIDVWYLVSLSGLFRQATRDAEDLHATKRAALTRMIGTPEWETDWYAMSRRTNLFGDTDERLARTAEVDDMERYFRARLAGLFPAVLAPLRLNDDRGIPQFALFFAISNPKTTAIGLASRIAGHILKSGISSKVRP